MKLKVMALVAAFNHHISMARAMLDTLEAHGIVIDGVGPNHIDVEDLLSEREDVDVESHLAMLREALGVDDPKPEPEPEPIPAVASGHTRAQLLKKAEAKAAKSKTKAKRKKRTLTDAGRAAIAEGQKKRWAAHNAAKQAVN